MTKPTPRVSGWKKHEQGEHLCRWRDSGRERILSSCECGAFSPLGMKAVPLAAANHRRGLNRVANATLLVLHLILLW